MTEKRWSRQSEGKFCCSSSSSSSQVMNYVEPEIVPPPRLPRLCNCWSSKCCRLSLKRTLTRSGPARARAETARRPPINHTCVRRDLCPRVERNHHLAVLAPKSQGAFPTTVSPPSLLLTLWMGPQVHGHHGEKSLGGRKC